MHRVQDILQYIVHGVSDHFGYVMMLRIYLLKCRWGRGSIMPSVLFLRIFRKNTKQHHTVILFHPLPINYNISGIYTCPEMQIIGVEGAFIHTMYSLFPTHPRCPCPTLFLVC